MIVLDTNILSEVIRPAPSLLVRNWMVSLNPEAVFTTSITRAELLLGIGLLPAGRRKSTLGAAMDQTFEEFSGRILAFDDEAAPVYAAIFAERTRMGRPISQSDAMIAAICRSRGATIATRNVTDFENCGITVVNPWKEK